MRSTPRENEVAVSGIEVYDPVRLYDVGQVVSMSMASMTISGTVELNVPEFQPLRLWLPQAIDGLQLYDVDVLVQAGIEGEHQILHHVQLLAPPEDLAFLEVVIATCKT